jgi:hypothetical protein
MATFIQAVCIGSRDATSSLHIRDVEGLASFRLKRRSSRGGAWIPPAPVQAGAQGASSGTLHITDGEG